MCQSICSLFVVFAISFGRATSNNGGVILQRESMTVHYQETLQLEFSLQNLTQGDTLIAFEILMEVGQQKEKTVVTALKDGTSYIQRLMTDPTIFGDRFSANFSKAEQMITIFLRRMEFKDDGLKFRSKLDYTEKNIGYIRPPPSVTTTISVIGKPIQSITDNNNTSTPDFTKDMELKPNQTINFIQYLSGNPKPKVTLYLLDGKPLGNITSTNISKHTYKYELVNQRKMMIEDCGKYLLFNATNSHGFIDNKTRIIVDFDPKPSNVVSKIENGIVTTEFEPAESGQCEPLYQIKYYGEPVPTTTTKSTTTATFSTSTTTKALTTTPTTTKIPTTTTAATTSTARPTTTKLENTTTETTANTTTTTTTTTAKTTKGITTPTINTTTATLENSSSSSANASTLKTTENPNNNNKNISQILYLDESNSNNSADNLVLLRTFNITKKSGNIHTFNSSDSELLLRLKKVVVVGLFRGRTSESEEAVIQYITTTTTTTTTTTPTTTTTIKTTTTSPNTTKTKPLISTTLLPTEPSSTPETGESLSEEEKRKKKKALIIAIAAGCGAVAFTILFIILWCMCCPKKEREKNTMQMQSIHEYDTESNSYNVDGNTPCRRDPIDLDLTSFKPVDDAVISNGKIANNSNNDDDDDDSDNDDNSDCKDAVEEENVNEKTAEPDDDIVNGSLGVENEAFGSEDEKAPGEDAAEMKNDQFKKPPKDEKTNLDGNDTNPDAKTTKKLNVEDELYP